VNPYLAVVALVFMVSLMLMLPLMPALLELRRKSDALPLSVVQENAGEIRYFANSFRAYIHELEPTIRQCVDSGSTATGTLPNGEEYVVLGRADGPLMLALGQPDARPMVITAGVDLIMPAEATFSKDIYAGAQFTGGEKNNYRTILGEKDVHLGASSRVLRWVHAVGEFTAELGCKLLGRVSSDSLICLHADCSFLRLNAPRIEIGRVDPIADVSTKSFAVASRPEIFQRLLHDGDFEVQAGEVINTDLVVRGRLRIGAGARICGSVKSVKEMVLEDGVSVEGSLISASKMYIGPHCSIRGPVVAERELGIATGVRCGSAEHPTTVSAPSIDVQEGVVVFGTLWARDYGQVVAIQ
jgi:cytoskeletal protein CcmA (bactofilin family)